MDQVYTADYDTSRFEQGSKRIDAASARTRERVTGDYGVMGRSAEQFGKKVLAGGAIAASWALATASVRAFAETSEDGAAKLKALSDARTAFLAGIGRDIAADGFRDMIDGLKLVSQYRQAAVDSLVDAFAGQGASMRSRDAEIASERRVIAAREEKRAWEAVQESYARMRDEFAREARLGGLEGVAREREALQMRFEERLNAVVKDPNATRAQKFDLLFEINRARRAEVERFDSAQAARAFDERMKAQKAAEEIARNAEDAAVERQLSAFGANNATRTAARLAEFRLRAERELEDLAARGAGEGALARLRAAQGADERGLIGTLLRGMAEAERGSSVSLAGRGGVAGLAGQVFGPAERTKEQKDEERARRLEAMVKSLIDEVKGVRRGVEDDGAVVGVFGA